MTQSELAALKAELKAELLEEMHPSQKSPWHKIRVELEAKLDRFDTHEKYVITSAIATIVRMSLGVKTVLKLPDDQAERAKEIANHVAEMLTG